MDVYGEFEWRGMVYDATEGLREVLAKERVTLYAGFDPTAASLHVGSLLPIMALARLQRAGHDVIALAGGGTGLIGDPSGKANERSLLSADQVAANVSAIRLQLEHFLDLSASDRMAGRASQGSSAPAGAPRFPHGSETGPGAAIVVNNADWLGRLSAVEFMRDIGKHFTVNYMLAKESVKRRLESEDGISYTEFSYLLLQASDFLELSDRYGCSVQIGGSDQWGNITAGIDLVRRKRARKTHGLVLPLVMTAAGTKFGKTEAGTVWLSPELTTPFEFYQFWLNADDRDAERYLKFFTWLSPSRIAELSDATASRPEQRTAQRELAREVTRLVHGTQAVADAESATEKLFGGHVSAMTLAEIERVFSAVPSSAVPFAADGWSVPELVHAAGVTASKGEALRLIRGGGLYVNEQRVTDEKGRLRPTDAIEGQVFVVRKGKRDNFLVRIASPRP
ncbi:MAG: tyrosine--tRNA ligase [Acidobacteria bacterium]|nr:tyrosine--tRNA ligase [Acidobacteriota bacterium]